MRVIFINILCLLFLFSCGENNSNETVIASFENSSIKEIPFNHFLFKKIPIPENPFDTINIKTLDFFPEIQGLQTIASVSVVKSIHGNSYTLISECNNEVERSYYVFNKDSVWICYGIEEDKCNE